MTALEPPEANRAQAELVAEERVVDAFAASAKAERRQQRTRRRNLRRREESRRSSEADTRLRHGVYEAFARESTVGEGLDTSVWPFVPLSKEAAAQMDREYAALEALVLSVERNHRLRRAPPRESPKAEPPAGRAAEFTSRTPSSRTETLPRHMTRITAAGREKPGA